MESANRKLAVLLHADVVGSTNLVKINAEISHVRIQECFKRSAKIISACKGKTVELRGDAIIAEFQRASDALLASLHLQSENTKSIESINDEIKPILRIGVALGEVVIANKTVTGDGIVLAQRLEQIAEPGGICVQGAIYDTAPTHIPVKFEDLGKLPLKGFTEPVQVFSVSKTLGKDLPPLLTAHILPIKLISIFSISTIIIAGLFIWIYFFSNLKQNTTNLPSIANQTDAENQLDKLSDLNNLSEKSIAVLAFDNMAAEDQAYFAKGIAEDILTELSRISDLKVIARSASFAYNGQTTPVKQIGFELGVAYLLDGGVRRYENRIRLNVQLIKVADGTEIWSERYDREMTDIFEIQQEVTELIVSELKIKLNASEKSDLNKSKSINIDAYDVFLRGLEKHSEFNVTANREAREIFKKATTLDKSYARAYASIALTHAIDVNQNWTSDREMSINKGLENVDLALSLDDRLPHAYFAQGSLFLSQGRHATAVALGRRGIELASGYADGHAQLAFYLTNFGEHEESLQSLSRAKSLNPKYSLVYILVEAMALFQLKRYQEVIDLLEQEIDRNIAFDRPHLIMAASYAYLGQQDDAEWSIEEALVLRPDITLEDERKDSVLNLTQDLDHYIEGLKIAGLQ